MQEECCTVRNSQNIKDVFFVCLFAFLVTNWKEEGEGGWNEGADLMYRWRIGMCACVCIPVQKYLVERTRKPIILILAYLMQAFIFGVNIVIHGSFISIIMLYHMVIKSGILGQ